MSAEPQTAVGISEAAFTTVTGFSALTGFCRLIPVPFVDDVVIRRVERRMMERLCAEHGVPISEDAAAILVARPSRTVSTVFKRALLRPMTDIVRKLVYVLALRSCADAAAVVFHEGWLVARTLEQHYLPGEALEQADPATLHRLRIAIADAREHIDAKPTREAMRRAFGVGREVVVTTFAALRRMMSTAPEDLDAAVQTTAPVAARMRREIRDTWSDGPALDAALRIALNHSAEFARLRVQP